MDNISLWYYTSDNGFLVKSAIRYVQIDAGRDNMILHIGDTDSNCMSYDSRIENIGLYQIQSGPIYLINLLHMISAAIDTNGDHMVILFRTNQGRTNLRIDFNTVEQCSLEKDRIRQALDNYHNRELRIQEHETRIQALEDQIKELRTMIEYMPGGLAFQQAQEDFQYQEAQSKSGSKDKI